MAENKDAIDNMDQEVRLRVTNREVFTWVFRGFVMLGSVVITMSYNMMVKNNSLLHNMSVEQAATNQTITTLVRDLDRLDYRVNYLERGGKVARSHVPYDEDDYQPTNKPRP